MADDSSSEIKTLIRRLDPKLGNHKDRIRAITKFRNYVAGTKRNQSTPEFYDDDLPLLFLGSAAPAAALDDDLVGSGIYGLMQACGSPSTEHDHMLKRSARHAMTLLKYLVVDFVEVQNGKPLTTPGAPGSADHQLNIFAQVFCTLTLQQYGMMNFPLHVEGDQRGGARDDACHVLVLLLTHHLAEDGETPAPLAIKDFLPYPRSQKEFELWLGQNVSRNVQQQIQRKSEQRQDDLKLQERQEQLANKELGRITEDEEDEDESENADDNFMLPSEDREVDVLAGFKRRKKAMRQEMQQAKASGDISDLKGPALTWEDSQLCREQKAREAAKRRGTAMVMEAHESVRDSQEAVAELLEREEEKAKVLGRDPLGMFGENFDLRTVQARQADFFEEAVRALEQEMRGDGGTTQHSTRYQAQKESLELIMDACFAPPGEGGGPPKPLKSVLPTDPNYDPLLFLTLVHRNATYEELMGSISRLSNKTENQVQQLQKLVRDNFALFVRCADGVDVLNEHLGSKGNGPGVKERLDTLDALAESCAYQAKKSFKPLLDNTSEVRKVQSTLAVLQRVAPILQAPYLMRHHVENGRFSQALKAYRRVLVIDEQCSIEILNHVREKAAEYAREARRELEGRLAQSKVPVQVLLDGIRDLGELLELDIPPDPNESERVAMNERKKQLEEESGTAMTTASSASGGDDVFSPSTLRAVGVYDIGGRVIRVRDHPPALACFLLQAAHFSALVAKMISNVENKVLRIFDNAQSVGGDDADMSMSESKSVSNKSMAGNSTASGSQWKYDVLDDRVHATIKAVEIARTWLPRILRIGTAAREDERRRAARVGRRPKKISSNNSTASEAIGVDQHLTAFEVFFTNIAPSVTLLAEHAAFCALGSTGRASAVSGKDLRMSFGMRAMDKLRNLLRSPLPPSQSARVGKELAELVEIVTQAATGANGLQAEKDSAGFGYTLSPLDETKTLCEKAVVTLEKRRCIYAFDVCSRTCASRASGSGTFDGEALLACLQSLSEQLTRPEQCSAEIVKGCELVVRRCCEGLASYVRDRGDIARLRAIAECAEALNGSIPDVVREVAYLTSTPDVVEEVINEDIVGLEGAMFDEFLDSIRQNVVSCCRIGWLDFDPDSASKSNMDGSEASTFPAYLSASLLAIVRCRAQVERALGDKIRRAEGVSYQHLAMATAAESVVRGICDEVQNSKNKMKVRQADRMANELHFLMNTLKSYLNEDAVDVIDSTRRMLCSKAGRGGGFQGDGPDGLAALEDLERLGRVYVLCLGE